MAHVKWGNDFGGWRKKKTKNQVTVRFVEVPGSTSSRVTSVMERMAADIASIICPRLLRSFVFKIKRDRTTNEKQRQEMDKKKKKTKTKKQENKLEQGSEICQHQSVE